MRILPAISLIFLAALPAPAQDLIPFATDFLPTFVVTESYTETVSGGNIIPTGSSKATITAIGSTQNIDLTLLDGSTPFSVSIGGFFFTGVLGDDPNFTPDATSMSEPILVYDNEGNEVSAGTVAVSWTSQFIKIVATVTRLDLIFVDAFNYIGLPGPIDEALPVSFSFADNGLTNRNCYITGTSTVTSKVFSGESYDLTTVTLGGRIDATRPYVTIAYPASQATVYFSTITLAGTAGDTGGSDGISQVLVQVNDGDFTPAEGAEDWSLDVDLVLGSNTVTVKSIDLDGNESTVVSRTFKYALTSPLTVTVNGPGSVTTGFLGKTIQETDSMLTITATPATGSYFDSWTGDVPSLAPTLTFQHEPNTVLQANFVSNPFAPLVGTYGGLISPGASDATGAGFFSASVTATGLFTATVTIGGARYSVKGAMTGHGYFSGQIPRKTGGPITLTFQLDTTNTTQRITGVIDGLSPQSSFVADKAQFNALTNPAPQNGAYTILLPPDPNAIGAQFPRGNGYGTLLVDKAGVAKLTATLGDGSKVSASATLSKNGALPLYLPLYSTGGLYGVVTFRNQLNVSDCDGAMTWVKPPVVRDPLFKNGFKAHPTLIGSRFTPLLKGAATPILNFTTGTLSWTGANVIGTLGQAVTLSTTNVLTPLTPLNVTFKFQFSTKDGLFSGAFTNPATGATSSFGGVVFTKQNRADGMFLGSTQTGSVSLQSP